MADKDRGEREEPSLEMPSLGSLLRRKKRPGPDERPQDPAHTDDESAGDEPTTIFDEPEPSEPSEPSDPPPASAGRIPRRRLPRREAVERTDGGGPTFPAVPGRVAAAVTGVVIGLLAVGATYLALEGCELARGTSSCGGPGLFLLLAILVLLVFLGGVMLRLWGVRDPMSTSFLAVGLLAVVALLFLIDVIFSPWMLVVVPVVTIGTFLLSHWVTTAFVDEG